MADTALPAAAGEALDSLAVKCIAGLDRPGRDRRVWEALIEAYQLGAQARIDPVTQPLFAPPLPCQLCGGGRLYGDNELLPHLHDRHPEYVNPDPGPYLSTACLLGLCAAFDRCGCAQVARGEPGPPARKYDLAPCAHGCHRPTLNGDPSA